MANIFISRCHPIICAVERQTYIGDVKTSFNQQAQNIFQTFLKGHAEMFKIFKRQVNRIL